MFSPNHKPIIDVFIGPTASTTTEPTTTTLPLLLSDTPHVPETTTTPSPVETNNNTAYDYTQQTTTAQPNEYPYRTPATTTVANNVGYPTVPDVITTTTTQVNQNPQVNVPSKNESTSNGEQSNPLQVDETSPKGMNDTSNTTENMYSATAVPAITSPQESVVTAHVTEEETSGEEPDTSNTFIFVYTL